MCPPGQSFTMSVRPNLPGEELIISRIVLEGEPVAGVTEAKATIAFAEEGNVQGYGGCNRFFGGYRLEGDLITFSAIASTRRYCEETMAVEDALFMALGKVTKLKVSGEVLTLLSEDGGTEIIALIERVESDG
jgi:heat shock protein HslJ